MSRSSSIGVWLAASMLPNSGSEILPLAPTRVIEANSGTSKTLTSIKSSLPIRYSSPASDVGVVDDPFEFNSCGTRRGGATCDGCLGLVGVWAQMLKEKSRVANAHRTLIDASDRVATLYVFGRRL